MAEDSEDSRAARLAVQHDDAAADHARDSPPRSPLAGLGLAGDAKDSISRDCQCDCMGSDKSVRSEQ